MPTTIPGVPLCECSLLDDKALGKVHESYLSGGSESSRLRLSSGTTVAIVLYYVVPVPTPVSKVAHV